MRKPYTPPNPGRYDCTKGKLNRMFKYFRNKPVRITYEYNNSLGWHQIRRFLVKYDAFEIVDAYSVWTCRLTQDGKEVHVHEFDAAYYFTGVGKLEFINSGPRCCYTIEHATTLEKVVHAVLG